jgi:hypothetical protein
MSIASHVVVASLQTIAVVPEAVVTVVPSAYGRAQSVASTGKQ